MAIAYVGEVGKNTYANASTASTTLVVSVANATTAGHVLVARIGANVVNSTISSVTDTKSNTWHVDVSNTSASTNSSCFIASTAQNGGALTTSDTITITFSTGEKFIGCIVDEFSGVDTSSTRVDSTITAKGTGTSWSAGTLTYAANELCVVCYESNKAATTFTPGTGWSSFTTGFDANTTTVAGMYQIPTSGTSTTTPATGSGSSVTYEGAAASYKVASGPVTNPKTLTVSMSVATVSVKRSISRKVSATAHLAPTLPRKTNRSVSATLHLTATSIRGLAFLKALSATAHVTATLPRRINRSVSATAHVAATLPRRINRKVVAAAHLAGTLPRRINRSVAATAHLVPTAPRRINRVVSSSLHLTATSVRGLAFLKTLSTSMSLVGSITKTFIAKLGEMIGKIQIY